MNERNALVRLLAALLLLLPSAARPAQDPPPAATGGAPGLRYEIWVDLDAAGKMLLGKEEIVWTNPTAEAVPDMLFHLYWNAFKNEDSAFLREAAAETMFAAAPRRRTASGAGSTSRISAWPTAQISSRLSNTSRPTGRSTPATRPSPGSSSRRPSSRAKASGSGSSSAARSRGPWPGPATTRTPTSSPSGSPSPGSTRRAGAGTVTPTTRTPSSSPTSPTSSSTSRCPAGSSSAPRASRPRLRWTRRPDGRPPPSARPWSTTSPGWPIPAISGSSGISSPTGR